VVTDARGQLCPKPEAVEDVESVRDGRRVLNAWVGGDVENVTRDIGHHEADQTCGRDSSCEAPTLEGRDMLSDGVHIGD
jgi:hypothetical protein